MEKGSIRCANFISITGILEGARSLEDYSAFLRGFIFLLTQRSHDLPPFVLDTKQRNKETYK